MLHLHDCLQPVPFWNVAVYTPGFWELPGCPTKDLTSQALESLDLSLNPRFLTHLGMLHKLSKYHLKTGLIIVRTPRGCRLVETKSVGCPACNQCWILGEIFSFLSLTSEMQTGAREHFCLLAGVIMMPKVMDFGMCLIRA